MAGSVDIPPIVLFLNVLYIGKSKPFDKYTHCECLNWDTADKQTSDSGHFILINIRKNVFFLWFFSPNKYICPEKKAFLPCQC